MQLALDFKGNNQLQYPNTNLGVGPYKTQLLKWIGNKQRFAHEIISFFPKRFGTYHEPFLGSGAVLGVLAPQKAEAADSFKPLITIWQTLKKDPEQVKRWYRERWEEAQKCGKVEQYEKVKNRYNSGANAADFLVSDASGLRWRDAVSEGRWSHVYTMWRSQTDPFWHVWSSC